MLFGLKLSQSSALIGLSWSFLSFAAPPVALAAIDQPTIPAKSFSIAAYGALGDGAADNAVAIGKTVAAAEEAGGGTVEVPAGRYLTSPFALASNIDLKLDSGATLLIEDNLSTYPMQLGAYVNCITATDCHDIAITGSGTIDGQGAAWWPHYKKGMPAAPHRPFLVVLTNCTRVLVDGVTLTNSPNFHLVPIQCTDVTIRNVTISAPSDSPNTDGIDPSGWNYLITGCKIDVGDDNIAIKPSKIDPSGKPSCENFTIDNCTFLNGHGMSIGGQTPGGLDGMTVTNCTFDGTTSGIRMKAGRGFGGLVQNVSYSNLTMSNVRNEILITSYYPTIPKDPSSDPAQPVGSLTPIWRHIQISNVKATGGNVACTILGLPEMPVSGVTFNNVQLSAKSAGTVVNAENIQFNDSSIIADDGKPVAAAKAAISGISVASPAN